MFGYVRPFIPELRLREYEYFKAVYCGLCHALARRYGPAARFLVNYDMTFLCLLFAGAETADPSYKRCIAHPLRARCIQSTGQGMDLAADVCVLLAYWKAEDDVQDASGPAVAPARANAAFWRGAARKAADARPAIDGVVRSALARLREIEQSRTDSLDLPADAFANLLSSLAGDVEKDSTRRVMQTLLYHTGRFIYIVDACDDLAEDQAAGRYNPVAARFGLEEPNLPEELQKTLQKTLDHSLQRAFSALELLDLGQGQPVLANILCQGMPLVGQWVLDGRWKKRRKGNERSI